MGIEEFFTAEEVESYSGVSAVVYFDLRMTKRQTEAYFKLFVGGQSPVENDNEYQVG